MQLFVPKWPIMWELSVSKLKFERFANSKNAFFFLSKMAFYTQNVIVLAKMILDDS